MGTPGSLDGFVTNFLQCISSNTSLGASQNFLLYLQQSDLILI